MKKYQILLVDDHKILLEGTQSLLSGLEKYEVGNCQQWKSGHRSSEVTRF